MVEYLVYLTAVSGLLLLRFTADTEPRSRVYLTPICNPVIFSCVATLIVIQSAVAHIVQALVIVLLFGAGSLVYRSRWWSKLVSTSTAAPDLEWHGQRIFEKNVDIKLLEKWDLDSMIGLRCKSRWLFSFAAFLNHFWRHSPKSSMKAYTPRWPWDGWNWRG